MRIKLPRFLALCTGSYMMALTPLAAQEHLADVLKDRTLDMNLPADRAKAVARMKVIEDRRLANAQARGRALGLALREFLPDGTMRDLVDFDAEGPVYYQPRNLNAAISTGASTLRNSPYGLDGSGLIVGIWEGSLARNTHQEFATGNRLVNMDAGTMSSNHASHVAGIVGAYGVDPSARGMANAAKIHMYTYSNDSSELVAVGANAAGQTATKIHTSNHSYGPDDGWAGNTWGGTGTDQNAYDVNFGQYSDRASSIDSTVYSTPYLASFWACGNDGTDNPATGTPVVINGVTVNYNPAIHPPGDGVYRGGFETINAQSIGKNTIAVGAVNDAVTSGARDISKATLVSYSSKGPADDGRIKPDLVANGASLWSTGMGSDTNYLSMSGTSMASPNACGSATLLVDQYNRLLGSTMRASTLKALLIHTADDLGNPGPDYTFGWGLVNVKQGADLIASHAANPTANQIKESSVSTTIPSRSYAFQWDGVQPITATIAWTDPAATTVTAHDSRTPTLVNNLNLKLIAPNGTQYFPYVMPFVGTWTTASMSQNATTGINNVDNVEQVRIANPGQAGVWIAQVSYTGTITNNTQDFGLIISGLAPQPDGIIVQAPAGSESWGCGSVQNITWSSGLGGNVKIELLKNNSLHSTIVASTPNTGSYSWSIPTNQPSGVDYQVRITSVEQTGKSGTSLGNFSIPAPVITGVSATASSQWSADQAASNLVNNSGISTAYSTTAVHSYNQNAIGQWHDTGTADTTNTITFALGGTYTMYAIHIWNGNQWGATDLTTRGVRQFDVLVSSDGTNFTEVISNATLTKSPGNQSVSAQSFSLAGNSGVTHVRIHIDSNWGDTYRGLSEVMFTGVAQSTSYIVSYNAIGATSGTAPVNQTKTHDVSLTLATNSGNLARTGYTFVGWNTAANGSGTDYAVGASYTANAPLTLYAKWIPNTYTVTLDAQGGTGGSTSVSATYDSSMPAATAPTRAGYTFDGYYTAINGGGTQYYTSSMASAINWNITANTTLYANWSVIGNGTWLPTASGPFNWGDTVNWINSGVADGADKTAFFTPNITAAQTVNLESARTIGNITFTDSTTSSHDLTISGASALTLATTSGNPMVHVTQSGRTLTISSQISGTNGLKKEGPGNLVLSSTANNYSGGTFINAGSVKIAADTNLGSSAAGITFTGSGTLQTSTDGLTLGAARTVTVNNGATASLQGVDTNAANSLTIAGNITGAGGIQLYRTYGLGGTTINLNGTGNAFSGPVTISGTGNNALNVASLADGVGYGNITMAGGSFNYTGNSPLNLANRQIVMTGSVASINANGSGTGSITIGQDLSVTTSGAKTLTLGGSLGSVTNSFNGRVVDGSGTVSVRVGSGWALNGANTYTGTTTILGTAYANSIKDFGVASSFGAAASGAIAFDIYGTKSIYYTGSGDTANRTFDFRTYSVGAAAGGIYNNGTGALVFSAGTFNTKLSGTAKNYPLTLGGTYTGGANEIQGVIQNAGNTDTLSLIKVDAGTWKLSGINTYTGTTAVNAGKLFINGDQTAASGAVSVANGATLGGTGTIGGSTTIAAGGTLEFNLSTTPASHDKLELAATKTLAFSGASVLTITSSGGASTGTYVLLTAPGGITGSAPSTVNLPAGWIATVAINGNNLELTVTTVGDITPPTLVGMVDDKGGSSILVNTPVTYTVTFSEDMDHTTVTSADFGNAGTASGVIGSVTETTPGVFQVAVTPTTAGSLRLRVNADAVLNDASGNALNTTAALLDDTQITVNPPNTAPVANAQTVGTAEDTALAITLTGTDAELNPLSFTIVSAPSFGTLSGTAPNLTFTPPAHYNGTTSFTFTVNDGALTSAPATVTINVNAVNDAPVAIAQSTSTAEDTAKAITLAGTDVENSALTYSIVSPPANGTLSGSGANVTFTPAANFNGTTSFTFKVNDGAVDSAVATVTITVTAVNDAPVFITNPVIAADATEGVAYAGQTLATSVTNSDAGDVITYSKVSGPAWLVVASNGALSGTPPSGSTGLNSFLVRATDSSSLSADATLQITVTGLPLPWIAADIGTGMLAGSTSYNAGTFTQAGSGVIGGTSDRLRYTYQTLTGDGEIIARISGLQDTGTASRVGVMIRDTLATNSQSIFMGLSGSNAYRWDRRTATGGTTSSTKSSTGTVPNTWVRLVRSGTTITAYKSTNGTSWTSVGSTTNTTFAATCYIGLAVGSGATTTLNTSQFSNVSVTP